MRTFIPPIALFVLASSLACSSTPATGSDSGTDASASVLGFTPSNIGHALDGVDTSKLVDIDIATSAGEISTCAGQPSGGCFQTTITQPDQTQIDVYFARSWRIEPNSITIADDSKPVVIVALTTIEILGRLDASAEGISEGAGGFKGVTTSGGGKGGGSAGSGMSNTPGVGGGGASFCGAGGAGGNASASVGQGGATYGTAQLIPLVAGSGGGGSALFGGGSGGAIQLVAGTSITVEGIVAAGGGGGYSGNGNGTGQAGSGGGSGGALLLEAPIVTISGTLAVNGGGGGGGNGSPDNQNGADATANGQVAAGGNPSTTGAGGTGGAGSTKSGTAGAPGDTTAGSNAAGGGGGGAGYIRINSKTGAATVSGTLSPGLDSMCATQGTLAP